jgi:hypothetical protein
MYFPKSNFICNCNSVNQRIRQEGIMAKSSVSGKNWKRRALAVMLALAMTAQQGGITIGAEETLNTEVTSTQTESAEEKARKEAEAAAAAAAEEQARLEAEAAAAEKARLEAEAAEKARFLNRDLYSHGPVSTIRVRRISEPETPFED